MKETSAGASGSDIQLSSWSPTKRGAGGDFLGDRMSRLPGVDGDPGALCSVKLMISPRDCWPSILPFQLE